MARKPPLPTVVILVDHGYVSGGQAKVAIESALGLARAGVRTIFFAACGPLDPRLAQAGIETFCLDQHDILNNPSRAAAAIQGTWNLKAARALAELLARLPREDTIVHMHGWAKAISPSVSRPIRASGLPAAYTMHEYFLVCPNGGFYDFQRDAVCKLEPMSLACWASHCDSRNYPFKLWRNARLAVAQATRFGDCFSDYILISDLEEQLLDGRLPTGARAHRVCNPVEVEPLGRKAAPASGDTIFVGRLSAEKGAPLFAQAARSAGIAPVFIGDGPIAGELARDHPEARLLGWRSPAEVRTALRAARALVFPSLWRETLGLSPLEAKGLGTPAIVSDVCGAKDEIADGVEGLWFRSGDVGALAEALRRLMDDALVTRLSHAAYDSYWRNPPTLDRHVAETLRVYEAMLTRRRTEEPQKLFEQHWHEGAGDAEERCGHESGALSDEYVLDDAAEDRADDGADDRFDVEERPFIAFAFRWFDHLHFSLGFSFLSRATHGRRHKEHLVLSRRNHALVIWAL